MRPVLRSCTISFLYSLTALVLLTPQAATQTLFENHSRAATTSRAQPHRIAAWGLGGRFFGSPGRDSITAMTIVAGSVYVCGWTDNSSLPGASNQSSGGRDAFVAKFSADGALVWATLIGGSSDDAAYGIAATPDIVAIVGMTRSPNFPTTNGVVQPTYGGGDADGFVATFDPATGMRRAVSYIGGNQKDVLYSICIFNNNIAVAGLTNSENMVATTHQLRTNGLEDGYVAVFNSELAARVWSSYYGGRGNDMIKCISYSPSGEIVLAGTTNSPNGLSFIADGTNEGYDWLLSIDGFVALFSSSGTRVWGRYYGSIQVDSITSCSVSPQGLIVITGFTNGTNTAQSYLADAHAAQNNFAGGEWDGFIAVLRPDGTRLWGSYYGGSGSDRCTGAVMDAQGYVLVTGWTTSNDLPLAHSDNATIAGAADIMIGLFSPDGRRRYASLLYGGSGDDLPIGIGYLPDSTILITGSTSSASFSPLDGTTAGALDGFLLRLQSLGILSVPLEESTSTSEPLKVTGEYLQVEAPESCRGGRLRIYSLTGLLMTSVDNVFHTAIQLPAGVYAAELSCDNGEHYRRLVVIVR